MCMRFHPVALAGDLKQAFSQVRIKKEERDELGFHWKSHQEAEAKTLRFTRALFGPTSSIFLLGGVIVSYLDSWEARNPELFAELRRSLYVDDLVSRRPTVKKVQDLKRGAIEIFEDATEVHIAQVTF